MGMNLHLCQITHFIRDVPFYVLDNILDNALEY